MSDLIQHALLGQSRVATQYTRSAKFLAYLEALLKAADELEGVLRTVALQMDIDAAEGVNLDVLGDIVGVSRVLPESLPVTLFGFEGYANAGIFGEEGQPSVGYRFRNEDETGLASSVLQDIEYRLLIRAKIVKNHSRGTGQDLIDGLLLLFNLESGIAVFDGGSMEIGVGIGRLLTSYEQALLQPSLNLLVRPSAVNIVYISMYDANDYFGFADQVGAGTFGEEGSPSIGSPFAEQIGF